VLSFPYSLAYVPLETAISHTLPTASMVNKYGSTVVASAATVNYAILDKGATIDPAYN
jgi:hypothetical protein